jgi:hypothetical protein
VAIAIGRAAFRLANRSQAKVGLLRGTLRSRAQARCVSTRPGVYPAKAGHPRPRGVYSGSICNQTNGLKVIIYHSRRVPETGNSAGKESQVLCLALCYF